MLGSKNNVFPELPLPTANSYLQARKLSAPRPSASSSTSPRAPGSAAEEAGAAAFRAGSWPAPGSGRARRATSAVAMRTSYTTRDGERGGHFSACLPACLRKIAFFGPKMHFSNHALFILKNAERCILARSMCLQKSALIQPRTKPLKVGIISHTSVF